VKKILPLLPVLLLSVNVLAASFKVKNVIFEGNKFISTQKLLLLIKSKSGADYSEEVLREDVKRLAETGYFADVSCSVQSEEDGTVVIFRVKENPVIKEIQFTGNRQIKTADLSKKLGVEKDTLWDESKFLAGLEEIRKLYQEKGLVFTEVTHQVEPLEEGIKVVVQIEEGQKRVVREIVFEGNKSFPASRLRKLMKVKQRRIPFSLGRFKQEDLEKDISTIETFYKNHGYLDVSISSSREPAGKERLIVRIKIEEGLQYRLGKIRFAGNLLVPETELQKQLVLVKEGDYFDESKAQGNLARLQKFYFDRGYIQVQIQSLPEPALKDNKINLTYQIEPGNVFTVDEVVIRGNVRTKDKVIRREVVLAPGDTFSVQALDKTFGRLRDLNYFEEVRIFPEFSLAPDKANLVVDVKEKEKTGILMFGGGFSSVDKLVGFISLEQTNFDLTNFPKFTGGGQDLKLWLQIGQTNQGFYLSFTEPYFLDRPVWLGTDLYRWTRDWDEYDEKRLGGDIRFGRRWEDFSLGFTVKSERITLSDVTIPSIASQAGTYWKNSLTTSFEYSRLDSRLLPTRGFSSRSSLEYAGGPFQGDLNFWKLTLEENFYYPLPFKKTIFHSKTYLGTIRETGDTSDIPIFERFFGGGIGTVRGYEERSLGPKDPTTGEPLGGRSIFAQSLEVLYPIYQDILKGVFFFDIGNVWDKQMSFGDLRKGAGAGLRIMVPLFRTPIQIDYGIALDREKGQEKGRFHFGMSFGF